MRVACSHGRSLAIDEMRKTRSIAGWQLLDDDHERDAQPEENTQHNGERRVVLDPALGADDSHRAHAEDACRRRAEE